MNVAGVAFTTLEGEGKSAVNNPMSGAVSALKYVIRLLIGRWLSRNEPEASREELKATQHEAETYAAPARDKQSVVDETQHLLADEHHQTRDGAKNYIATTVGSRCCLGAELAQTAGAEDLQAAYGGFKTEAQDHEKDYLLTTVSTDGWASTRQAWQGLFSLVVILRCFLHGWLAIRCRGKLSEGFETLSEKVWDAYHAADRKGLMQRLRRLQEWSKQNVRTAWVLDLVMKLCGRGREYGEAYHHVGAHRTSNMLDRVMRGMNRFFDSGQHFHGGKEAANRHCRAWALLSNFRPCNPATARLNKGWRSPAERVSQHS